MSNIIPALFLSKRATDTACIDAMVSAMKELRDVSDFIRKPALYVRAVLRSARDFTQEVNEKGEHVLIPEVHSAIDTQRLPFSQGDLVIIS